jgi:predicted Zn-dependent protease
MKQIPEHCIAAEVMAAFEVAQRAGHSIVDCYGAAVAVWQRYYPADLFPGTTTRAVDIVLSGREKVLLGTD